MTITFISFRSYPFCNDAMTCSIPGCGYEDTCSEKYKETAFAQAVKFDLDKSLFDRKGEQGGPVPSGFWPFRWRLNQQAGTIDYWFDYANRPWLVGRLTFVPLIGQGMKSYAVHFSIEDKAWSIKGSAFYVPNTTPNGELYKQFLKAYLLLVGQLPWPSVTIVCSPSLQDEDLARAARDIIPPPPDGPTP